jgi:hypothetical protein
VYQLLPIYPCVERPDGTLGRVTEVDGIPGLDLDRAAAALAFHRAIREAVDSHRQDTDYLELGYKIKPLAGIFQPTSQSARPGRGGLEILRTYQGVDGGGDGTVPSVSATPLELSNADLEAYVRERHASLQNADFSLDQVLGVIRRQRVDQSHIFAPGTGISLDLDDVYLAGEPVGVRALPEREYATLTARVLEVGSGREVASAPLRPDADAWHAAELGPFAEGTYRLRVHGDGDVNPVTDVFAVFAEGSDLAGVGE